MARSLAILRMRRPLGCARSMRLTEENHSAAFPHDTVLHWLTRHGQTERLIELLWEPLTLAALNQPSAEASALALLRVLGRMFSGSRQDAAIALPLKPLDDVFIRLAHAFIEKRGGVVRVGTPAAITLRGGRLAVRAGEHNFRAHSVVCAVPWFELPSVLAGVPPLMRLVDAAARTSACVIVTVNLWFDRTILEDAFVGLPGRSLQWAFATPHRSVLARRICRLSRVARTPLLRRTTPRGSIAHAKNFVQRFPLPARCG